MRCKRCQGEWVLRVGSPVSLLWRRFWKRNLYVCNTCRTAWRSSECRRDVRVLSSSQVRIHKGP